MKFRRSLMVAALVLPGAMAGSVMTPAARAADMADSAVDKAVDAGFTGQERQVVEKYYGKMPAEAQPDDTLPPGLARRDILPPGLAQRDLPADLEEQLPPPPAGYERRIVGDSAVVLIDTATGMVADIIKDILIPGADD